MSDSRLAAVLKWLDSKEPQVIQLLEDAQQFEPLLPEKDRIVVDKVIKEALVILPKLKAIEPLALELISILQQTT